jgi:signal transduction histidine kinase
MGIPPDKLHLVFERFGRAHGTSYGGLGLGLTIARGIVERHGGRIWAESSGRVGEGSTFHVVLPQQLRSASAEDSGRSRQSPARQEEATATP